jgi:hypothetical protein
MFCDSPASATDAQLANHHPISATPQLHTLITGTIWVTFSFMLTVFLNFLHATFTADDEVARLMATTSFGIFARRAEQCVLFT